MIDLETRRHHGAEPRDVAGGPVFLALSLAPQGRSPALPGFTPDHRRLVVPNEASDNVSVVALEPLRVERVVPLRPGSRPWQAKVLPDRGELALITQSEFAGTAETSPRTPSSVAVVDLDRGAVREEIRVGAGANGVTVDQAGRWAYVVNMRSDTVSVVDLQSFRVVGTIQVGRAPAFAKLTRDRAGRLALVTNLADASLSVIDTRSRKVVRTIEAGVPLLHDSYPEWGPGDTTGVAVTDEDVAFVTNYRSHTMLRIDLRTWAVDRFPSPVRFPFFVEVERRLGLVVVSSGIEGRLALLTADSGRVVGSFRSDGTDLTADSPLDFNVWMTEPRSDRITALCPRGIAGISTDWSANMVTKFM